MVIFCDYEEKSIFLSFDLSMTILGKYSNYRANKIEFLKTMWFCFFYNYIGFKFSCYNDCGNINNSQNKFDLTNIFYYNLS